jgi:hypothetical protein
MTPESFANAMRQIFPAVGYDEEISHQAADTLLCETLRELGYGEGVAIFEEAHKWYA